MEVWKLQGYMANLRDPYQVPYQEIIAIASKDGRQIELIECFDCIGGGMWAAKHYAQSPLVTSVRKVGTSIRYHITPGSVELQLIGSKFPAGISGASVSNTEITITYIGMGGGGVGASVCRAKAKGVPRAETTPCGGGRLAGSTVHLRRMERIIIGIDDTDTKESGATWALVHNIAREVEDDNSRYLSHTLTQLFPVAQRTKNCVAVAIEFATTEPDVLIDGVQKLVKQYTLSDETGMVVFRGFDPSPLEEYAWMAKRGEVTLDNMEPIKHHLDIRIDGSGIIGATAAIPFYTRFDEALELCGNP
jgi:methanogenesis imperfect marker protein 11